MQFLISNPTFLRQRGFTIIEGMAFLFIFALVTSVFFQTFAYGTALIQQSKYRLGATALANQKMEIIRSLDYDNIGTTAGIPTGDLVENETINVNGTDFSVHTFVQYIDDSFDGTLGGSPNDLVPNDYKRVRVEVSWGGGTVSEQVSLTSNIAQQGVEQPAGGGILSINILDSEGDGVSNVSVHIVNNAVAPSVDVTTTTDATGNVFLIGAPASAQGYEVTFSRSGYYGSASYAPYPTTSFNPTDVHASVVDGVVNQATFVMDQDADMALATEDPFGNDLPDIDFRIDGGRQIGTVVGSSPIEPVYSFGEDSATDGSGEKSYTGMSYGVYTWTLDAAETNYTFVQLEPDSAISPNAIEVTPDSSTGVKMVLADEAVSGVLITVRDTTDATPLAGASVRLTNTSLGYDTTVTTSQYGKAYFPDSLPALVAGTYDVEVSATGFTTETDSVTIGSSLELLTVDLSP